ncbi:ABC transporter ATP-binding protein [Streptococcus intermedius]|uniref:ABC transporter ATP-binding protein n=1 Tax=Streptococcus intermedius TaxID=1338 RepID=UPI00065F7A31|nr:ABC transporter ATP-binding protein [Streptococcus intermedius]
MISIENVNKTFKNKKGIFDIDLKVEDGHVLGFIGPNGAGKSTTIRHLMGFLKPDSGCMKMNGFDCWSESEKIKNKVGYLPGEIVFPSGLSAKDFLDMQIKMRNYKDTSISKRLIERFKLNTSIPINKMSKGMKQKLAIVCTFMCDPDIIILDEPSTGLDPLMQKELISLLYEEKSKGKTIFLSSHNFEEIEMIADEICIIKQGRLVENRNMKDVYSEMKRHMFVQLNDDKPLDIDPKVLTKTEDNKYSILINDNENDIIRELARHEIASINIEQVSLRDIFQKYYEEEE